MKKHSLIAVSFLVLLMIFLLSKAYATYIPGSQINTSTITGDAADDKVLLGTAASAAAWSTVPNCATGATSKLLYDQATNTFSCGTDQTAASGLTGLSDVGSATTTAANILVADGTKFQSVGVSGDITITSAGATAIGNDKVGSTQLSSTTVTGGTYGSAAITVDADGRITNASAGSLTGLTDVGSATITAGRILIADGTKFQSVGVSGCSITSAGLLSCTGAMGLTGLSDVGSATATAGRILVADGTKFQSIGVSGCSLTSAGLLSCTGAMGLTGLTDVGSASTTAGNILVADGTKFQSVGTPLNTTTNVINISNADSLTTGSIAQFISNSSSTETRTLVQITNDHTSARFTTALAIRDDSWGIASISKGPALYINPGNLTIGTDSTFAYASAMYISSNIGTTNDCAFGCYGIVASPTLAGPANTNLLPMSVISVGWNTGNTATTYSDMRGIAISNANKGAGDTITTLYGLYINAQTSGATNYAIYSAGGQSYHAGNVGIGPSATTPAVALDVDGNSNTAGFRIRGADYAAEIGDFYMNSGGSLTITTELGTDSVRLIELDPADDLWGLILRDSSDDSGNGASTASYTNFYMTDAATDYLNIVVNATTATLGLVVDDDNQVGIGMSAPTVPLNIDTSSNSAGIRLLGLAETTEIADIYVDASGGLILDATPGNDTSQYIDLRPEDNQFGLMLRESSGANTTTYANFYVVDAATDYVSINVSAATTTSALNIMANNRVGIGTVSPAVALDVSGEVQITLDGDAVTTEALCATQNNGDAADTANMLISDCSNSATADYAEIYPTAKDVEFGDIVVTGTRMVKIKGLNEKFNPTPDATETVIELVKSSRTYQSNIIGVTSNNYNDFTSTGHGRVDQSDHPLPVALNGRVKVKVVLENGPISVGDYLTSSSTPGAAMKATEPGQTIGVALEPYSENKMGQILCFISPVERNMAQAVRDLKLENKTLKDELEKIKIKVDSLSQSAK